MSVHLPLKLDNLQNSLWLKCVEFFSTAVEAIFLTLTNMHIITLEIQTEIQTYLHVK